VVSPSVGRSDAPNASGAESSEPRDPGWECAHSEWNVSAKTASTHTRVLWGSSAGHTRALLRACEAHLPEVWREPIARRSSAGHTRAREEGTGLHGDYMGTGIRASWRGIA
jgi:hypothetical protein